MMSTAFHIPSPNTVVQAFGMLNGLGKMERMFLKVDSSSWSVSFHILIALK